MKSKFLFILAIMFQMEMIYAQDPHLIVYKVATKWVEIHNHFAQPSDYWGDYTLDLTLEALLVYDSTTNKNTYIELTRKIMDKREIASRDTISYHSQPFCSINFTLGMVTGDHLWFNGFIGESYKMLKELNRSPEGAIMINHKNKHYILIDYLQEYAGRMAKTGHLSKDSNLYTETVRQFLTYESILRDSKTGLWSQGRGWMNHEKQLSPGAWSRGHGWLLRGIVTSMKYLPLEYRNELMPVLKRTVQAIVSVQAPDGMWHILLHLPHGDSEPDVSGTGMIAYYLSVAVNEGWISKDIYKPVILKATNALRKYVTKQGDVLNSCKGPGPLRNASEYLDYQPEINEKHGFQGMIYGMTGEILISQYP